MKSTTIAISAVSSALGIVLLVLGTFISVIDISCVFTSSIILMLPLYKKSLTGAFLSFLSTAILSAILTGFRFQVIIPYAIFFGLHPIVNDFIQVKNINKWFALVVKTIWFIIALFVIYKFTNMFVGLNQKIVDVIYWLIPTVGAIFFIAYDFFIIYVRKKCEILFSNIGL